MASLGNKVAVGATWMVGVRLLERSIGFISTLILARLLLPDDFGVVAMALTVFAFIEIAGQFGFDFALIRDQKASRRLYDSAWTLKVCYGTISAIALILLAPLATSFFSDPRVTPVIYAFAAIAFFQSFENIGIINFRKEFQFNKDFQFVVLRKVVAFVVTISLAVSFQSYWALIAGIATSRLFGVVLSYTMHPYRPKIDFSETKVLYGFSKWIVITRITEYFSNSGPMLLIGRFLDSSSLGIFSMGREIATLPTSEMIHPIMRAVFPGYAALGHDKAKLAAAFLKVQGILITLALPAGIGIVMVAEPFVHVLLGQNWLGAIPVIQVLGLYGALTVFQATNNSIFNVLNKPYWGTVLRVIEVSLLIPGVYFLLANDYGLQGVVWMVLVTQLIIIPFGISIISHLLQINFKQRLAVSWRPALSAIIMTLCLYYFGSHEISTLSEAMYVLILNISLGLISYSLSLLSLWYLIGKPVGVEHMMLQKMNRLFKQAPKNS